MKRGLGWPIGVAFVLVATVAANIGVLMIARADPTFAIEPDYYARALRWDDEMAQQRENALLGWRVEASLGAIGGGTAALRLALADSAGSPLDAARASVRARHNSYPDALAAAAGDANAGVVVLPLPLRHAGLWEIRIEVERAGRRFTTVRHLEAAIAR